jgi:isocitrate dehydrogenase (NAD+)
MVTPFAQAPSIIALPNSYRITVIPGDGIGREIVPQMQRAVEATGVLVEWDQQEAGEYALAKYGHPLPEATLESLRANAVGIKGPTGTPIGKGYRSVNVAMRQLLDMYACVRPIKRYIGVSSPLRRVEGIDYVIVRENTEDLYAGIEFASGSAGALDLWAIIKGVTKNVISRDAAFAIKPITPAASKRVVEYAFRYAIDNGRTKVTAVTKANIMKLTDGLFLEQFRLVAAAYPGIEPEEMLVDNFNQQIVLNPQRFDVAVMPNLYGDILSDGAAATVGGLGIVPGANIGEHCALFEAVHGTAPDIAGQNKANPTAMLLSAAMMLRHIGKTNQGNALEEAVAMVLHERDVRTGDLLTSEERGNIQAATTTEFTDAVIARLK